MGRGLSPLQKTMLTLAYTNRVNDAGQTDLYYSEVYAQVYDFPAPAWPLREHPGSHRWSRQEIGTHRYDAAVSAVSRAGVRLMDRGLAIRVQGAISHWTGLRLTDEGVDEARRIGSVSAGSAHDITDREVS